MGGHDRELRYRRVRKIFAKIKSNRVLAVLARTIIATYLFQLIFFPRTLIFLNCALNSLYNDVLINIPIIDQPSSLVFRNIIFDFRIDVRTYVLYHIAHICIRIDIIYVTYIYIYTRIGT